MYCALERFACLCLSMKCHPELFLEPCNGFHELALSISKRKYTFSRAKLLVKSPNVTGFWNMILIGAYHL